MARENPYLLVSGFISLSLFLLFVGLFFVMMFSASQVTSFALKKDTFISVSLDSIVIPTTTKKKELVAVKEKSQVIEEVKEVDIGDLFSDVWTKDIKIEKKKIKKVDNKRLLKIQKRIKKSDVDSSKKVIESFKDNEIIEQNNDNKKSSSADEVNEYLAKIQAIVYRYFKPPSNSQGHTVKARIDLSAIGKVLDFRILTYSSNVALNQECDRIKARLNTVLFPSNPEATSSITIVNITSDEN